MEVYLSRSYVFRDSRDTAESTANTTLLYVLKSPEDDTRSDTAFATAVSVLMVPFC